MCVPLQSHSAPEESSHFIKSTVQSLGSVIIKYSINYISPLTKATLTPHQSARSTGSSLSRDASFSRPYLFLL